MHPNIYTCMQRSRPTHNNSQVQNYSLLLLLGVVGESLEKKIISKRYAQWKLESGLKKNRVSMQPVYSAINSVF